jgi:chitin synthase
MKDKDRQIAWREKVTLCIIIFIMNALILFFIVGIGWIVCPKKPQLSPGQVSSFNRYNDKAKVYMYGNYYEVYPIIKNHIASGWAIDNTQEFYENEVLGQDVSQMFSKDEPGFQLSRFW